MKKDDLYRFNIQFTPKTDEEVKVGEYLNALGRRKSIFIAAVIEYLRNHPELQDETNQIHTSTISADQLEAKIRAIVEEKLLGLPAEYRKIPVQATATEQISSDIVDMLDELELFAGF